MKRTILGLALLLLLTAGGAFANTSTANMQVLAAVTADCHLDSAANMDFGSLGVPFTINNIDATASAVITYTCTNSGVAPTVTPGQGANAAGGSTDAAPLRRMRAG